MINNTKVSIIIPVYNVEEYLERCLESLINQTYKNIEIIAIDNRSSDNSLNILNEYSKKDSRIKVLSNEETGVSQARNIGIKESTGTYIMFVDSDDWIDKDMVEEMYTQAQLESVDMVMCTYIREFKSHSKEKVFNQPKITIYENEDVKNNLLRKLIGPVGSELANPEYLDALGTVWAKLYRADVIKGNVEFVDLNEIGSAEDTLFNIFAFNICKKVVFLNKPMYHYWRDNPKSITSRYNPKLKEQRKVFFKIIGNFINDNKFGKEFNIALNNRICTSVLGLGLIECCKDNKISVLKKIKNIKNILHEEYISNAYKELDLKYFSIHWRVFYFFNKYKLTIPSFCMINSIEILRKAL